MKYGIIRSGKIGRALAGKFAENKIEVDIADSREVETLAPLKEELGPPIVPKSIQEVAGAVRAGSKGSSLPPDFLAALFDLPSRRARLESSKGLQK